MASASQATQFERWCRLELAGYLASNPAMTDQIEVPEYRTVVGQHVDIAGRILKLPTKLAFVGETWLRFGVEELEALAKTRGPVVIRDPYMSSVIQQHLNVDVASFQFSAVHIIGILSSIRTELSVQLHALGSTEVNRVSSGNAVERDEIIQLRPNFYGIGINLRALWRRLRGAN